jgi:hypothetical protein
VTSQHTKTDQMVGTVAYMSPERFDGNSRAVTPAADVFAWGAVVAYAASGRTPFAADSAAATAARILTQPPVLDGLSGQLRDLVAVTLAKEPQDRPTAHELLDLLLAHGPQEMSAGLGVNPELRHAAEAAQHSGRYVTGDQPGRDLTTAVLKKPARRGPRRAAVGLGVLALAGAGLLFAHEQGAEDLRTATATSSKPPVTVSEAARVVQGPSVHDRLDRPGLWTASTEDSGGCYFKGGALVATPEDSNTYQCDGPADSYAGDQSITVDVQLQTARTCATVWFRYVAESGYQVRACTDQVALDLDDNGDLHPVSKAELTTFTLGSRHLLGIDVHDDVATVTVDGATVTTGAVNDPSLPGGQALLGITGAGDGSDARVAYSTVDIKTL